MGLVISLLILVALIGYFVTIYNGLIKLKNNIKKAWANIDVLLKQRSDELPKLVDNLMYSSPHFIFNQLLKTLLDLIQSLSMLPDPPP